jgi:hypothetical protein
VPPWHGRGGDSSASVEHVLCRGRMARGEVGGGRVGAMQGWRDRFLRRVAHHELAVAGASSIASIAAWGADGGEYHHGGGAGGGEGMVVNALLWFLTK